MNKNLTDIPPSPAWLRPHSEGVILRVQAQPNASKTAIVGVYNEDRIKIRISSPPVEGAANEELLRFLKKHFKLAGVQFELLRGDTSKTKEILCRGASITILRDVIEKALPEATQSL